MRYSSEELDKRTSSYMERMESSGDIECHKPDEVSHWAFFSGSRDTEGRRDLLMPIVHGRFSDAVRYAVQRNDFYSIGWSILSEEKRKDPYHFQKNGKIISVKISDLEDLSKD